MSATVTKRGWEGRVAFFGGKRARGAFTLAELLTVIVIIFILLLITLPILSHSRKRAQAITCLHNLQQLQIAWSMYSDDHSGWLPAVKPGAFAGPDRWISGWLDLSMSPDNTNVLYLTDPRYAQIGPYIGNPKIFRCPSDPSFVRINGKDYKRVRSVSMNCWMNYAGKEPIQKQGYRVYRKISDMWNPSPSELWIIIDERFDSINDGMFVVNMAARGMMARIVDYPAAYHDHGASVVFADGHAIVKKWKDPRTTPPTVARSTTIRLGMPSPHNPDVYWLQEHATAPLPSQQMMPTKMQGY